MYLVFDMFSVSLLHLATRLSYLIRYLLVVQLLFDQESFFYVR